MRHTESVTNERTDRRTSQKHYAPSTSKFEVGGIMGLILEERKCILQNKPFPLKSTYCK